MKAYAMQGCHNYEDETVLAVYATRELALVALEARRPHQAFFEDRQVEAEEVEIGTDFDGCRGVWMEKHAAHIENWDDAPESFADFCMTVAAQNVLFAKLELAGELA